MNTSPSKVNGYTRFTPVGDWCKILTYTPPNVHVRWNKNSKNRNYTCIRDYVFIGHFELSEASTVSTILSKYE